MEALRGVSLSPSGAAAASNPAGAVPAVVPAVEWPAVETVGITIDGRAMQVPKGITVLEAAKMAGIKIPTLCHHPALRDEGACRACVVEVEGAKALVASCVYPVSDGMKIKTNTPLVRDARRLVVELLLARHPMECPTCIRNGTCELQELARTLNVAEVPFVKKEPKHRIDDSSPALVRDPNKCILCGRCVRACSEVQTVNALGFSYRGIKTVVQPGFAHPLNEVSCVSCGQCAMVCPVRAIYEKDHTERVWQALSDPDRYVVVQVAPAIRASLGEELGLPPGTLVTGKLAAALRRLGFDRVFDTQFSADLTIIEEGTELLKRLAEGGPLPLITSCSPGWIKFCEHFYPDFLENLSTCKSPQQMMGALLKTYFAENEKIPPAKIFSVSVMPCTAKKMEAERHEMNSSGFQDVDAVLTTRELARMIRTAGIDFASLPEERFDAPLGISTGAAAIFGATGGVMEAALRTVYELVTGSELGRVEFESVRGLDGVREATVTVDKQEIRVAVAHGLGNARKLLDSVREGRVYHFIEVMACPGGCIGGGGQPYADPFEAKPRRIQALYREDRNKRLRKSHTNPAILWLYQQYLKAPGGEKSHELLHTHYTKREPY